MLVVPPPALASRLAASSWRPAAEAHERRVLSLLGGSLLHDPRHPIFNFLFEYYSFDRKLLLRWSPGPGVGLEGTGHHEPRVWQGRGWRSLPFDGTRLGFIDPSLAKSSVRSPMRRMVSVLRKSEGRAPHLNCYGLHEWAMLCARRPPTSILQPPSHQHILA